MLTLLLLSAFSLDDDSASKIDSRMMSVLRKKIAGKITLDRKTQALQIAYDFRTPKQGNDFPIDGKPADAKNGLVLKPSAIAEHVVAWRTVAVEAQTQITKFGGIVIRAPAQKACLQLAGANFDAVYLEIDKESEPSIIPAAQRTGLRTLRFEIGDDSALAAHTTYQVTKKAKLVPAGKIEFHGGNYGAGFKTIVFRGKPDAAWLKEISRDD